ncbi:peptidyl-tRNA hydrolase [Podospora australis]|uniref:peptidyl-tRNA hydrolase n=1 Tax=Podospora australis TaxID=1536484 RepID=A0AAN7ADZ2_9PEZI|nr:peptidyl-tRNA hydrolase [Podospora australis]
MSIRRILVISLGNPGQYENTFHSAGHNVLQAFQRLLQREQPSFSLEKWGKMQALASIGPKYSLLQSPAVMNVSGPWVAKAYKEELSTQALTPEQLGVVLVHDDLEEELGAIKVRAWKASHRGHNGIKSVNGSLQADPRGKWARVSVGIGRPDQRDKSAVSDFVLSKMPRHARSVVEEKGSSGLLSALMDLETKWGTEY